MFAGSQCTCSICELERRISVELSLPESQPPYQEFACEIPSLSTFPTALDLIRYLHSIEAQKDGLLPDHVLKEMLTKDISAETHSVRQIISLMVFIPTVHRTTSRVAVNFPAILREDIGQYVLTSLLEFLDSNELRSRKSHFGFVIARKLRRNAFRWAVRESRNTLIDNSTDTEPDDLKDLTRDESGYSKIFLHQFLDACERRGILNDAERQLLLDAKILGNSYAELAGRNGHSAIAIQHRLQRVINKLRRVAREPAFNHLRQLNLFER